jgi:hypothetical protein
LGLGVDDGGRVLVQGRHQVREAGGLRGRRLLEAATKHFRFHHTTDTSKSAKQHDTALLRPSNESWTTRKSGAKNSHTMNRHFFFQFALWRGKNPSARTYTVQTWGGFNESLSAGIYRQNYVGFKHKITNTNLGDFFSHQIQE